jgi:XTP/dITP diphosphohydrolase
MTRLLVATENPGKLREIARALDGQGIEVRGIDEVPDRTPVAETGSTFEENARIKATEWSKRTEHMVLADDSGLEVDALGGAPGVHSARYGGPGLDDAGRTRLVLDKMKEVTDPAQRTARFRCVLALARKGDVLATFDGVIEGRIATEPSGTNGFGYDPIFFHPGVGCTFAEIEPEEKNRVSHRGAALRALAAKLRDPAVRARLDMEP